MNEFQIPLSDKLLETLVRFEAYRTIQRARMPRSFSSFFSVA